MRWALFSPHRSFPCVLARRLCAAGASCFLCNALTFILAQINLAPSAPGAAAIRQIHAEIIASVAAFWGCEFCALLKAPSVCFWIQKISKEAFVSSQHGRSFVSNICSAALENTSLRRFANSSQTDRGKFQYCSGKLNKPNSRAEQPLLLGSATFHASSVVVVSSPRALYCFTVRFAVAILIACVATATRESKPQELCSPARDEPISANAAVSKTSCSLKSRSPCKTTTSPGSSAI